MNAASIIIYSRQKLTKELTRHFLIIQVGISCFSEEVARTKEITMSLSKRFFLLGSILFMSAFFFTFSPQAPSAHAASVSPSPLPANAFSCPSRSICMYKNNDGTGTRSSCATDVCRGRWFSTTVGGVHAGSAFDNSNSVFVVADVQDRVEVCLPPHVPVNLTHSFGFFRALFGVTSCPPPSQLPPPP